MQYAASLCKKKAKGKSMDLKGGYVLCYMDLISSAVQLPACLGIFM